MLKTNPLTEPSIADSTATEVARISDRNSGGDSDCQADCQPSNDSDVGSDHAWLAVTSALRLRLVTTST